MDKVLKYLQQNKKRFVDELCEYVSIPSVSAQPKHKPDMLYAAEWLKAHAQSIGLQAEIKPTQGHPIVLARTPRSKSPKPQYMVYGHYDVQPPEPFDLWKSPPFQPRISKGFLYARGASDNKGQHMAHLNAVEAYLKTGTDLPCDLIFLIEGEEEVGSNNLPKFLTREKSRIKPRAVVISDTGIPRIDQPAVTYALRGIIAIELIVHGPDRDLHSGIFGGALDNPALILAQMLSGVRDRNGRVTIPHFYDDVRPLTKLERKEAAKLDYDEASFKKFLGVGELFGEKGFTTNERRSARPTFEINGLTSGYQGEGSKTIIPAWARAKITCRLVPGQRPEKVRDILVKYFQNLAPKTVRLDVKAGHGGEPYIVSPESPHTQAALRTLRKAFQAEPVLLREGGSIPIVTEFKNILGVDTLLLGLSLPEDNAHSPNERFSLECFEKGMKMGALLWQELSRV